MSSATWILERGSWVLRDEPYEARVVCRRLSSSRVATWVWAVFGYRACSGSSEQGPEVAKRAAEAAIVELRDRRAS